MAVVLLGIGSNVEREKHIRNCLYSLTEKFLSIEMSSIYECESIGFKGDNFYNLVVKIITDLPIRELITYLREIEDANGRVAEAERYSARTLDIDLLTYDNVVGVIDRVELPRDEILINAFVLCPLAELIPQTFHPIQNKTYETLWNEFDKSQQKIIPIEFSFKKLNHSETK